MWCGVSPRSSYHRSAGALSVSTWSQTVVAPFSAPHSRSSASTAVARPVSPVARIDLDPVHADPVVVDRSLAARPVVDGRDRARPVSHERGRLGNGADAASYLGQRRQPVLGVAGRIDVPTRARRTPPPRASPPRPGRTAAARAPRRTGGRPRRPRSNGSPGSPMARQELPRRRSRATGAVSVRSTHSPSIVVSTVAQSDAVCSSASRADTRIRTDGRGGTGLPETMSSIAISTGSPSSGCTTHRPSPTRRRRPAGRSSRVHRTARSPRVAAAGPPRAGPRRAGRADGVPNHVGRAPSSLPGY